MLYIFNIQLNIALSISGEFIYKPENNPVAFFGLITQNSTKFIVLNQLKCHPGTGLHRKLSIPDNAPR
ncbi:hypothetical protein A2T98_13890 [Nodularia spumigena CENA596]|uniref:Uncharacterized protein n=1 Tax=Nodularia spumigena CENA596 TaxID=1819295 RepID=A0A166J4W7_NODSP|nr:hypothetical protein A2T98_13890 [Nodularia spumigena CENA596]